MAITVGRAVVANTDPHWFFHFRSVDELVVVDEVNFWRPAAQTQFRALSPGEPVFFRLKHPLSAVAGFGILATPAQMSVAMAWEVFGDKNGDPNRQRFIDRIRGLREALHRGQRHDDVASEPLTSLVLRNAVFLPQRAWLPWGEESEWHIRTQGYRGYNLQEGSGQRLAQLLSLAPTADVPDLAPTFTPLDADARLIAERRQVVREGQGTFRTRLIAAYYGQCAVTGEHVLPVLEAAHIQPYLGPASNNLQNGLLLRSDLHRLYDLGYLTVTPELQLAVSPRLKAEFDNGNQYYSLADRRIQVPRDSSARPSPDALAWHATRKFLSS